MEKGILRGELQRNDCRGGGGWMSITSPPKKKGSVCAAPPTHTSRGKEAAVVSTKGWQ